MFIRKFKPFFLHNVVAPVVVAALAGASVAHAQVNLPSLGDSMAGTISTQQEYEFGRELLRQIKREMPLMDDPLILEYITSLTFKLAANSELTDHRLEFVLIDSQLLNAFAAPGGIIGVNAGLFQYAQNEGQFASVMAHELAHVSQRHYARNAEMARNNALPNMAALLAGIVLASTVGGDVGEAAIATSQAAALDNQLRYSRSNESEADRVGIRTLANAGFDPMDMGGMFENMLKLNSFSQKMPEFLSTHPLDETRIADSKNRASSMPRVQPDYNVEYGLMRERVLVHYEDNPEIIISSHTRQLPQLNGKEADATLYGLALAQLKNGQFADASESLDTLLRKEPRRITYVMLQADIAKAAGNLDRAIAVLEENLRINPSNNPLTMNYALTLEEAGQYDKAASVLQKQAQLRPNDTQLWYHLAEIHGRAGNISLVHQARAEYFFSIGEFGPAQQQLTFALNAEEDPLAISRIRQRQADMRQIQTRYYR